MRRLLNFIIAVVTMYCIFLLITTDFKKVQVNSFANFDVVGTNQFFLILAINIVFFFFYFYAYRYLKAWLNVHRKPQNVLFALQIALLLILAAEVYLLNDLKIKSGDEMGETIKV